MDKARTLKIAGIALGASAVICVSGYLIRSYFKLSDCDIDKRHFHVYRHNSKDITTTFDSERLHLHGYTWTDEIVDYSKSSKELYDLLEKYGMVSIYRNNDYLKDFMAKHSDYEEYEYWYEEKEIDHYVTRDGEETYFSTSSYMDENGDYYTEENTPVYKYVKKYDYTTDKSHSHLTGDARVVHYKYYGYKVVDDGNGKKKVAKSDLVDNLLDSDFMEYYPYFKVNDFSKVEYQPFKISNKTKVKK